MKLKTFASLKLLSKKPEKLQSNMFKYTVAELQFYSGTAATKMWSIFTLITSLKHYLNVKK